MTSPASRFSAAVETAMGLPSPRTIARRIMASTDAVDNGLKAARYDGARVLGGDRTSHPERLTEQRRELAERIEAQRRKLYATEHAHMLTVSKASERFCVAVGSLVVEVANGDPGDMDEYTWAEATKDAHLICQLRPTNAEGEPLKGSQPGDTLRAALELTDRDVHRWTKQAIEAVRDLRKVLSYYDGREADPWQQYKRAGGRIDEICEVHAALRPPIFKPRLRKSRQLCRHCDDLWLQTGRNPPPELIELHERGGQVEYRKARSRWIEECEDDERESKRHSA